jgi:hypothetical protein
MSLVDVKTAVGPGTLKTMEYLKRRMGTYTPPIETGQLLIVSLNLKSHDRLEIPQVCEGSLNLQDSLRREILRKLMVPERANFNVPQVGSQTIVRIREALYYFVDVKFRNENFLLIKVVVVMAIMKGNMQEENRFSWFVAFSKTEPESGKGDWI